MPNSAALPGRRDTGLAKTVLHEHPGSELELVCPGCKSGDGLQLIVPAECFHAVTAVRVVEGGITFPVVEVVEWEASEPLIAGESRAVGVRCVGCGWAFRGPDPTSRFVLP